VIGVGCFEKLLEVICGLSCLELKVALGSGNEFLVRVASIVVIIILIAACGDCDSLGSLLRPPLVFYGAHFHTLVGYLGWRPSIAVRGAFRCSA
jgi:hypothetical protein